MRTAGAEDMNRLGPSEYDVVRRSLSLKRQPPDNATAAVTAAAAAAVAGLFAAAVTGPSTTGAASDGAAGSFSAAADAGATAAASSSAAAAAAAAAMLSASSAAGHEEEQYTFDVFLTLITGEETGGETSGGTYTTGDLIPLRPGDPGVFKALADKKSSAPPCWLQTSYDGIEINNAVASNITEGCASHYVMTSLYHAGLMDRETRLVDYNADSIARWAAWEQQNNIEPNGPQEIHKGELLLTDKDLLELQEAAAIACSTRDGYHERRYRGLQNHGTRDICECDDNDSFDYDNFRGPEQKVRSCRLN